MKKLIIGFMVVIALMLGLQGCGNAPKADFTETGFEKALNKGEITDGKTVEFSVDNVRPDSLFGYNITGGEHLNFVTAQSTGKHPGDHVTAKVTGVENFMGSYIITYEEVK